MKKTSLFYITTVAVAIACLVLDLIFQDNSFSFLGICFSITMLVYGICLIIRGFHFKIDSSLFLGIIIFTFGVVSIITNFTEWGYMQLWHYILLGASASSLITGLYFKNVTQKKWSIVFLILFVITLCYQTFKLFNIWVMLGLILVTIIAFIIINNIVQSRRS